MKLSIRISLLLLFISYSAWSQEKQPVYIQVRSGDIKLKLFTFYKSADRLAIFFIVRADFMLHGKKESIVYFNYEHPFEKNNFIWAAQQYPAHDLKKIHTISMKAFTDSLLQPGKSIPFRKRKNLFLIIYDRGNPSYELYPVTYAAPELADPHDLYLEEPKKKN